MTKRTNSPPPPNNSGQNNVQSSGFFTNIIQGIALGSGSSIGHKITDNVFTGSNEKKDESVCKDHLEKYISCAKNKTEDCKAYFNLYIDCLENIKFL
jgi:hypothetical protein